MSQLALFDQDGRAVSEAHQEKPVAIVQPAQSQEASMPVPGVAEATDGEIEAIHIGTAAYSPDDNKIRITPFARLDKKTYERVTGAGFAWAPKQKIFVAPMWTPERADFATELCGEIGDEDTSLVARAEERADRFEDYRDKRAADASRALDAVSAIADHIPLGQPILVGHHSEKHARRDAERIENGMRKAVKMWETSEYWKQRASGALAHAKYKELPAVRFRRINGLEADQRKFQRSTDESEKFLKHLRGEGLTRDQALAIANYDHGCAYGLWSELKDEKITPEDAAKRAVGSHERRIAHCARWLAHIGFRLDYERAMLDEGGGVAADKFDIQIGGRVSGGREWFVVKKVNRANGRISSVSVLGGRYGYGHGGLNIEEVKDYRPPDDGDADKVKAATKLPPLVNYPGEGFRHMTRAEWDRIVRAQTGAIRKRPATEKHGAHRQREGMKPNYGGLVNVYVTDEKRKDPPPPGSATPPTFDRSREEPPAPRPQPAPAASSDDGADFRAMKESLRAGVKAVSVPQLFVTPAALARDVVERADVDCHKVLEPEAGLGALALECVRQGAREVHCIDNAAACFEALQALAEKEPALRVLQRDFLTEMSRPHERYLRIVINPPFVDEADIKHVTHAFDNWLAPGGLLLAIMSAGTASRIDKRTSAFRALVEAHGEMEELLEDSFKSSGTSVRTVLVTLRKES